MALRTGYRHYVWMSLRTVYPVGMDVIPVGMDVIN
jgi:hypothetical protein